MKKTFMNPEMEELEINETANGLAASDDFDDTWVEIDGHWYRPGNKPLSE